MIGFALLLVATALWPGQAGASIQGRVVNAGTAAPVSDASEIVKLLVEQVTGQVRWRETIEWFARNGVTSLYEIGSGKVLTGLVRRIDKSLAGTAVNTPADIEAALAALNG